MAVIKGTLTRTALYGASTFEAVLKESYAPKVYEQLNDEVFVLSVMEKKTAQWSGKTAVLPLHIGRNASVGYAAENAAAIVPLVGGAIGTQNWQKIHVDVVYLYGAFAFTGPAMAACKTPDAVIDACEKEMERLKEDIKNEADRRCFSGSRVLGFLNERKDQDGNIANPDAARRWEFTGDLQRVRALRTLAEAVAGGAETLVVGLVRLDNYTYLGNAANDAALRIRVTAEDLTGGTVSLASEAAANIDTTQANWVGAAPDTGIAPGVGIAVVVLGNLAGVGAGFLGSPVVDGVLAASPQGIFDNLAQPDWYTLSRRSANDFTAGNDEAAGTAGLDTDGETHAIIRTMNFVDTHGRASLTGVRAQMIEDEMLELAGSRYDSIVVSPVMQSEYVNLMQQVPSLNTSTDGARTGDLGFTGLAFNGTAIKTARQCPRGLMLFLTTDTWGFYELKSLALADEDGSVLSRAAAQRDVWEGFAKWYYNIACTAPKKNAILVGIDYAGAVAL